VVQIPTEVAKLLRLKSRDLISVSITTPKGELLYRGLANMGSGKEIDLSVVRQQSFDEGRRDSSDSIPSSKEWMVWEEGSKNLMCRMQELLSMTSEVCCVTHRRITTQAEAKKPSKTVGRNGR
jgi:hypothetical protein